MNCKSKLKLIEIEKNVFTSLLCQVIGLFVKLLSMSQFIKCVVKFGTYTTISKNGFLAFTRQQKAKCVTCFVETLYNTTVRKIFQTKYREIPPARGSILGWVENFNSYENVENRTGRGRPQVKKKMKNDV